MTVSSSEQQFSGIAHNYMEQKKLQVVLHNSAVEFNDKASAAGLRDALLSVIFSSSYVWTE